MTSPKSPPSMTGLGPFLRSLTGLDREAASKAFDGFQAGRTLSADQLHFLNLVIDYLARNGTIDVASLYEPPFTNRAPQGPEGIFDDQDVDEIVTILRSVQETASPRSAAS
jgi:type I restriction enzyme R subunit